MNFTQEEINKACEIAGGDLLRIQERFKPADKPVIKDETAFICRRVYLGPQGPDMTFSFRLQWTYPVGGAIGRITQEVHTRLRCTVQNGARSIRIVNAHIPEYAPTQESTEVSSNGRYVRIYQYRPCIHCPGLTGQGQVLEEDTSLHEF